MTVYTVVKRERMIPFSGLSRFSGLFDGDGPSPLNRDTTVLLMQENMTTIFFSSYASERHRPIDTCWPP